MDFTKYSFAVEVPLEEDADEALLETKAAVIEPIFVKRMSRILTIRSLAHLLQEMTQLSYKVLSSNQK